jgi:hypothetical protein
MFRPGGYGITTGPEGISETDTFTCCHCNTVVDVPPKMSPAEMGGWCVLCMKPVCKGCAGKECVPFEKKLEAAEARDRFRRSVFG